MEKLLKVMEYRGEKYEIRMVESLGGTYFLKDFRNGIPFSPYYYCVADLGFVDTDDVDDLNENPMLRFLLAQAEQGARHWADNKQSMLAMV